MSFSRNGARLIVGLTAIAAIWLLSEASFAQNVPDLKSKGTPANVVWIDSFDLRKTMYQEYDYPVHCKSMNGNPLRLNGVEYPHGVGTHSVSELKIALNGSALRFVSMVGLDDEITQNGAVTFEVYVDGKKVADSGVMLPQAEAKLIDVDLTGAKEMMLRIGDGDGRADDDHADWAGAMLILGPNAKTSPKPIVHPILAKPRLVSVVPSAKPAINGARIVGTTPGNPFLFLIPATGKAPLTYSAKNLPTGLKLDKKTGIITGSVKNDGTYKAELIVSNVKGTAKRSLTIVAGKGKLALTPPMGWNSWNVWAEAVDGAKTRAAADVMVKSGLAAHGYQYVNIDDSWEGKRDANGEMVPNKKFPNMKSLGDYIHSKGLKFGIYSSPGPMTCAQYEGSYQHEAQDAKTYASWGVDYLKYDWCYYRKIAKDNSLPELIKPYKVMGDVLPNCGRDIVYSLCQIGMGEVWKWGADVNGNLWRTEFDLRDAWWSVGTIGFRQAGLEKYAGPGHWNDPDMLVVGKVGWGPNVRSTNLFPNEQVTHISLWSMLAAPLLTGCDFSQLDQFTYDLLTNDEVIAIDQDPLGRQASRITQNGQLEVWSRPLFDGTIAVGLFNRSLDDAKVTANWSDLGISGAQPVRDLWLHKNLGSFDGSYIETVPAHGTVLIKIGKPKLAD